MTSDNKKSYYAVIPATVRYDNNVVPGAKLLYGEITALCNEKGYCWATNDYFSRLYSVSKRTISTWIKSLCDAGYISAEFVLDNESKKVKVRCLKVEANFDTHPDENFQYPHEVNFANPMKKTSQRIIQLIIYIRRRFLRGQKSTSTTLKRKKFLRLIVTHICWRNSWKNASQKTIRSFHKTNRNASDGQKILI